MKSFEFAELKDTILEKYPKSIVGLVIWEKAAAFSTGTIFDPVKSRGIGSLQHMDSYKNSAVSTWPIGNILAYVNFEISMEIGFQYGDKTYCIGHSLGAHLCSFYSKMMTRLTNNQFKLQKILGLDPAGPLFETIDKAFRLREWDANSVEIWHTNTHRLGIKKRIGTVDIYINGGYNQPQCGKIEVGVSTLRIPFYSEEKSHKFAKYILKHVINLNLNIQGSGCFAEWICSKPEWLDGEWQPWSLLKNIKKRDPKKLEKAGCQFSPFRIGQLEPSRRPNTINFPVYWIEIDRDAKTCKVDLELDEETIEFCHVPPNYVPFIGKP